MEDIRTRAGSAGLPSLHLALLPLAVLVFAEGLILTGAVGPGVSLHAVVLFGLLSANVVAEGHSPVYDALVFLPLLRLLNLGTGLLSISPLVWLFGVYALLLASAVLLLRANGSGAADLGLLPASERRRWVLVGVGGVAVGAALGGVQWALGLEQPPVEPTPVNALWIALVTGVVVGLVEELLFRGMIQRWLAEVVDRSVAVFAVSVIFGFMHSVWLNAGDIVFAFLVSLLLGWVYARTRHFWFIVGVHATINVTAFAVLPLVFGA